MKTSNIVLIILGILTLAFIVTMIIVFITTGQEMEILEGCFFALVSCEGGILGWIKTTKVKEKDDELDSE